MELPEPIKRLVEALNAHDPVQVADAFTVDYRAELPMHPDRGFVGNAQVKRNYVEMFDRTPDLSAEVLRWISDGDTIWSEWEMTGTGPGDTATLLRGIVIAEAPGGGPIAHTRFYIEPVNP